MPYVNIRIAGSLSREQKQQIAQEITDTLERVAHKPKSIPISPLMNCRMKAGPLRGHCWEKRTEFIVGRVCLRPQAILRASSFPAGCLSHDKFGGAGDLCRQGNRSQKACFLLFSEKTA